MNSEEYYATLNLPPLSPPPFVFPIAWSIIYALIIIGASIIEYKVPKGEKKKDALGTYWFSFILNALWPYTFFVFKMPLIALIVLIALLIVVVMTFIKFYRLNKISGLLFIPYILWLIYAAYINLGVVVLS
jgi:tryptophan-rich sensory protein